MSRHVYSYKTINGKKKRLHRHVMEAYLGRSLKPNEHIYHINGNPADNRVENLVIIIKNSYISS